MSIHYEWLGVPTGIEYVGPTSVVSRGCPVCVHCDADLDYDDLDNGKGMVWLDDDRSMYCDDDEGQEHQPVEDESTTPNGALLLSNDEVVVVDGKPEDLLAWAESLVALMRVVTKTSDPKDREIRQLRKGIQRIVKSWEGGDLAGAVNEARMLIEED